MHRVRIGLTGLACVFLLVMLATAFLRGVDNGAANVAAPVNAVAPSEPLAELGVAPGGPQISAPPPLIVPPPIPRAAQAAPAPATSATDNTAAARR